MLSNARGLNDIRWVLTRSSLTLSTGTGKSFKNQKVLKESKVFRKHFHLVADNYQRLIIIKS